MAAQVSTVDSGRRKVSRRITVAAPAADLFALVADPRKHSDLDGSGTVRSTVRGPERLSAGASFTVGMRQFGVPYAIRSKVTAFDDGTLIEWRHPVGHRWRWEFAETAPGVTTVTETFDYSHTPAAIVFEATGVPAKNAAGISKTLEGLAATYG